MPSLSSASIEYEYVRPDGTHGRSPCPALNALANHGYINRNGLDISFCDALGAIRHVYNLSFPLALFLTFVGFVTAGKFSFFRFTNEPTRTGSWRFLNSVVTPVWTLDLASLSARGITKIAHNASLVHPDDIPSTSPDPVLLNEMFQFTRAYGSPGTSGLSLSDLGRLHTKREKSSVHQLSRLHEQVALGECGLAWLILRASTPGQDSEDGIIPLSRLEQWFGEERLPDHWWEDARPLKEIGLFDARRCANQVLTP